MTCTNCENQEEYIDDNYSFRNGTGICLKSTECAIAKCNKCKSKYTQCSQCHQGFYFQGDGLENANCVKCNLSTNQFLKGIL